MKKSVVVWFFYLIFFHHGYSQTFDELLAKGDQFYADKNYAEAEKYFTQAITADSKNPKGFWYRGDAREKLKNHDGAIDDYNKTIELGLTTESVYKARGDSYYNKAAYQLAANDYTKAIELAPARAILWFYRADCYKFLQEIDKACSDYQTASKLGDSYAKPEAAKLKCAWAKDAPKPCPTDPSKIDKVEVEPFTGLVAVSKGIEYSEIQIVPKETVGYVTAAEFGTDLAFSIKVMLPKNFCEDASGNIFPGMSFKYYDMNDKLLGGVDDLYESYGDGFPGEEVSYLSLKLTFDKADTVVREGKEYLLKVRLYDKKGNKELLMELPFKRTEKTRINSSVEYGKSSLGPEINSAAVNASVAKVGLTKNGKPDSFYSLQSNQKYSVSLSDLKNLSGKLNYQIKLVNKNGTQPKRKEGSITAAGNTKIEFTTDTLSQGDYILWLKLGDTAGNIFSMTIPAKIN